MLRKRNVKGYKFLRQKPIDCYILDFYCSKLLLGIEVDGDSHINKEEADRKRTARLNEIGIKIVRYRNEEVLFDLAKVCEALEREVDIREAELRRDP